MIPAVEALADEIGFEVLAAWAREAVDRVRVKYAMSDDTPVWAAGFVQGANTHMTRAVSWAYRMSGNSAEERAWQRRRLGELLVGF